LKTSTTTSWKKWAGENLKNIEWKEQRAAFLAALFGLGQCSSLLLILKAPRSLNLASHKQNFG